LDRDSLSYQIIVDWVIAEHKSQGFFQTTVGQNRFENVWVFSNGGSSANKTAPRLKISSGLERPQMRNSGGLAQKLMSHRPARSIIANGRITPIQDDAPA
jgi:hypothetical protein